jgi:molybdopterin-binding protein
MADYLRIGEVAKTLGVSVDTLRRWESSGRLQFDRVNGQRVMQPMELHKLINALGPPTPRSSARNHLVGTVVSVERDGLMAKVEMTCGDFRIVSLMSREAADELGLEPGVSASAVVKATNVVIER